MGLTERHWFENEDVPENYEWDLEDAVYNSCTNKKPEDSVLTGKVGMTMADREKVVKGLEECAWNGKCTKCQYRKEKQALSCKKLLVDALELLKEQPDVVKCEDCKHCGWATKTRMSDCRKTGLFIKPGFYCAYGERKNLCKNCKTEIRPGDKYCRECGSKI